MSGDLLKRTTDALDKLNDTYRHDRYLAMAAAAVSFLLLCYIALRVLERPEPSWALIVGFFGTSGLLTAAMIRIAYFFNEGYKLVAAVVQAEIRRSTGE